jgi:hypothetical protein
VVAAHVAASAIEVRRLGHYLKALLGVQDLPQPAAYDRMVVGDHHPDRRCGAGLWLR